MRLLLFDIDGTLLDCGPQVKPLFAAALTEVFGTAGDIAGYSFAGCTDGQSVLDLMTGAGFAGDEVHRRLPRMKELYLARLAANLDHRGMRMLPGVPEILPRLAARHDLALALLTGNWEEGARTKLSRFDLNRFFPFGAFGCDGVHRSELPPVALARAERSLGRRFAPHETLIIGDSLKDVACGRDHGIPVLAVATGRTPAASLRDAGADWIVPDLTAAGQILAWWE